MPADELGALEEVYVALLPADLIKRSAWLFTSHVELPRPAVKMREGKPADKAWEADQEDAVVQRRGVVADLLSEGGIDAIFALAQTVELPYLVGEVLAQLQLEPAKRDAILMGALTVPSRAHENVGLGIVKTIFRRDGEAWAARLLSHASSDRWGTEAIVRILTALPETKWTWQQAAAAGKEVEDTYWSRRSVFFINSSTRDAMAMKDRNLNAAGVVAGLAAIFCAAPVVVTAVGAVGLTAWPAKAGNVLISGPLYRVDRIRLVPQATSRAIEMDDYDVIVIGTGTAA